VPKTSYETYSHRWGALSKEIDPVAEEIRRAQFTSMDPPKAVMVLLRKHARVTQRQADLTKRYLAQTKTKPGSK
jgi:hypothetical protein